MKRKVNDIVRGLYSCNDQQEYINEILSEAQRECTSKKEQDKLNGLQKLPILYLLGVDVKQFGFTTLDCVSSADQKVKRCGYFVSSFTFGREETRTLSTNAYIRDIRNKDQEVRHMALGSLASCTTPQKEQVYALFPVLFEELRDQSTEKIDIRLMSKLIATILHLLIASQKAGIENLQEYVSIFVDLLGTIQQNDKTAILRSNIAFMQLWTRTGVELGVNLGFSAVMKLVPIYADLLQNQTSPWVTTQIISFLGRAAAYDQRVAYKLSNQVSYFLHNTESKSLLIELAKQIVTGFSTNQELISLATSRISKYVVRTSHHQSDSNLRALALKNLASLERVSPGSLMRVESLPQELLKSLSDTDFNQRILVLDVISCLATHQYVDNIITTLLTNLQNTKTYSQGSSLQSLHKQSSEDIKIFRQNIVRIVIQLITNPDLIQSVPVQRVLGVLSTLIIEYPNESSNIYCHAALKLMVNQNIASEWKEVFVLLAFIVLNDENIYQHAIFPGSEKNNIKNQISLFEGPIQCNQRISTITESLVYTQINQLQDMSIYSLLHNSGSTGFKNIEKLFSQNLIGSDFYKELIKFSEFEINSLRFKQSQIWITDGSELVSEQQADSILNVNNVIQTQAYILSSYFIYQQGGDNAVNIYNAIKTLLAPCIKYTNQNSYILPLQTIQFLLFMVVKLFTTSLVVMSENDLFSQEEIAQQFVTEQYSGEFAIKKEIIFEEAKELKQQKLSQYNPFEIQDESGEEEFETSILQSSQTLINIYVKCYIYIIETLQHLAQVQDLRISCNQCYNIICASYQSLFKLVEDIQNNDTLKEDLKNLLSRLDIKNGSEEETTSPKDITEQLLSIQSFNDFSYYLKVEKPNFSFEDGTMFNLNNNNQNILSDYDLYDYQPEEWELLYKQKVKQSQKQSYSQTNSLHNEMQNILSQQNSPTDDVRQTNFTQNQIQSPASVVDTNKNAMDQLFGQSKQENNVYIINSLNKNNEKQNYFNKYIQNIQYKKQVKPNPVQVEQLQEEEPQQQQDNQVMNETENKQEEHKKKRKHKHKHRKKDETDVQEQENKSEAEQ